MSAPPRRLPFILAALALIAVVAIPALRMARRVRSLEPRHDSGADSSGARAGASGSLLEALTLASGWANGTPPPQATRASHPIAALVWSDTDPASLKALAAAEAWREAYARYGLIVLGVHEPDFAFAADSTVPARAARRAGAAFPIALDPAGEMRRRIGGGETLPFVVVSDTEGRIIWRASGTTRLLATDRAIRAEVVRVRPERNFPGNARTGLDVGLQPLPTLEEPAPRTLYLGGARVSEGPLAGASLGRAQPFTAQFRFQIEGRPFVPYPVGWWTPTADGLTAARPGAENYLALRYDGDAVYAVLSPPPGGRSKLWILRDEAWLKRDALGEDARLDPRGASYIEVTEPRLYLIARGTGRHVLKLSPEDRGLTLHALSIAPHPGAAAP